MVDETLDLFRIDETGSGSDDSGGFIALSVLLLLPSSAIVTSRMDLAAEPR